MELPQDDFILLSLVNTYLRDGCPSMEELCSQLNWEYALVNARLSAAGYEYNEDKNRYE